MGWVRHLTAHAEGVPFPLLTLKSRVLTVWRTRVTSIERSAERGDDAGDAGASSERLPCPLGRFVLGEGGGDPSLHVALAGDAALLARHFLALFAHRHGKPNRPLDADAAQAIAADRWPGNIRGLRQTIERAVLLGTGDAHAIGDLMLSPDIAVPHALAPDLSLARNEAALITAALERHAFNVSRAAAQLGLTRAALYRRMARHGL